MRATGSKLLSHSKKKHGFHTDLNRPPPTTPSLPPPPANTDSGPPPDLTVTVDGSCGKSTTCLGSTWGNCCSSHGWCGVGPEYCSVDAGCQKNFGQCGNNAGVLPPLPPPPPPPTLKSSTDGTCGNGVTCLKSDYGNCCSKYGFCGSSTPYCSEDMGCQKAFGTCGFGNAAPPPLQPSPPPPPPPPPAPAPAALKTSTDGVCGNGKTCSNSVFGSCCSSSSWCGSTSAYCSEDMGCQSAFGTCGKKSQTVSADGRCSSEVTCLGSSFGGCCSKYNYCGRTDGHCEMSEGCQSSSGECR